MEQYETVEEAIKALKEVCKEVTEPVITGVLVTMDKIENYIRGDAN